MIVKRIICVVGLIGSGWWFTTSSEEVNVSCYLENTTIVCKE